MVYVLFSYNDVSEKLISTTDRKQNTCSFKGICMSVPGTLIPVISNMLFDGEHDRYSLEDRASERHFFRMIYLGTIPE